MTPFSHELAFRHTELRKKTLEISIGRTRTYYVNKKEWENGLRTKANVAQTTKQDPVEHHYIVRIYTISHVALQDLKIRRTNLNLKGGCLRKRSLPSGGKADWGRWIGTPT